MEDDKEKFTPRSYQVDLMKRAIQQNTIIYLPTGSGKTFIAVLVLKQLAAPLVKSYNEGGKISFILVNSVALVDQHKKYVKDHTVLSVGGYSGEMNLDNWRKDEWEKEFNKYQVIIMTCQIINNLLENNFITLDRINLLIFDECHRGVDDHSMRLVMKKFQNCSDPPRVLGLTATLLNGNCKLEKVMDQVRALEITYQSKVATVDGLDDVIGFSTNPQEVIKFCLPSQISQLQLQAIAKLEKVINTIRNIKTHEENYRVNLLANNLQPLEPKDILKDLRLLLTNLINDIKLLGTFGGYKACLAYMISIERVKKHCQDNTFFVILNYILTMIGWVKTIFQSVLNKYSDLEKIQKFSSDKVLKLIEILNEYKSKSNEELCCLIFVQRKFTAKLLHYILQALKSADSNFQHIRTNFIVGNKNNPHNDTRESLFISKKNREIISSFINKEINILVSSNVLEEGVDIPKCTLVIKFDKPTEYRSYIQSKGRARHKKSLYYIMVEKDEIEKYRNLYLSFQKVETLLNSFLVGRNEEREIPSESDINSMYNEDLLPPYYVNGPNSAQVNMTSAISLLSRYCNSLAPNQYTAYAPEWLYTEEKENGKVKVVVLLPVCCPILDPIQGPYMLNKRDAKRATALLACIKLHQCGELGNDLLPVKKELNEEDISYLFQHWPKEKESRAGLKKQKRLHNKEIACCIKNKIQEQNLYLHVIELNPLHSNIDDFNLKTVVDLYKTDLCFGLLSSQPLPEICKFPIYDSNGTIEINVKVNVKEIQISNSDLMQLREFHFLIFNDLLEILKQFLIFDNNGTNSEMLLLVPVRKSQNLIDFDVVRQHKSLKNKFEPTASERMNLQVNDETYLHKMVSPWYRTQPNMYVVTRVCADKSPMSQFPNLDYSNFVSYYEEKHNLKILDTSQPLLLVKGISKKLNMLKPTGRVTKRKKEKRYEEVEEYLIPELVIKQEFPSCLWIQARSLPSILTRLTFLLKLQQLQTQIAHDVGLDEKYLKNCPTLQLDINLLNYVPADEKIKKTEVSIVTVDNNNCLPLEISGASLTQQYNKDFALKILETEYPWKNIDEPKDIERELDVTIVDIEHYETFISQKVSKQSRTIKNDSSVKTNIPAITYDQKFEEKTLKVLDIKFDNQCPNLCDFYTALSAAEANDIVNLERLETLGDSFLKLIASLYIIFKFPIFNEGKCTSLKGRLVSNKNLYYAGVGKNLGGILRNSDLSPNDEYVPPCFCIPKILKDKITNNECSINSLFNCYVSVDEQISGNLSRKTFKDITFEEITSEEENSDPSMCNFLSKQYVSDKCIADSVEALLGAFFLNGGFIGGIKFTEWIGIIPKSENLENLIKSANINPILNPAATVENVLFHLPLWREIENRLGYHFKNPAYLLQALTHASYTPNRITQSYERLEFLGDAVLDFLITSYIYEHCGVLGPGQVTDLRSALVNNNTFASLVVRCGFHKFLLMINLKLQGYIDKFADYLATKNYVIDDEVLILLEEDDLNIAEYVDVPKVLGDIFESLAGAIYLDSGKSLQTVWKVFYKIMWREIDLFSKNVPKNIIRRLHECHTAYPQFSAARETDNNKTMVSLQFMCEGRKQYVHGFGSNKTMAKRAAAKIALQLLKA